MKRIFVDQLENRIEIEFPPKRIVSLVPSQTELLFDLGLDLEIVGITKFCIHPEDKVDSRIKVGGTKKLNLEMIRSLKPDLIIGNKEENERGDIELLQTEFPVWMSDICDLDDALRMIESVGEVTDRSPEAGYLIHLIKAGFSDLQRLAVEKQIKYKALYMIWRKPYMAAGRGTFIDDVLRKTGITNVLEQTRYPVLDGATISALKPDMVMLSSEPYPFVEKHLAEFKDIVPGGRVLIVDGEMFSWYGSRLVKAIEYLFYLQQALLTEKAAVDNKDR